ncbi:MAG: Na+/H+ antiporter NhaA [Verrucomicrobiales bacterium]
MNHPLAESRLRRLVDPFVQFARMEASSGMVLMACAVMALGWANSQWSDSYFAFWRSTVTLGAGAVSLSQSLEHWINDGLMALFFFLVGLEIKRELLTGELAGRKKAALPVAAALGGMLVPAGIYASLNWQGLGVRGWSIPMATDIAFSLGVLALLGKRVPLPLKVFLTALAIVDDLGAVLVIALFYSTGLSLLHLVLAAVIGAAAWIFGRFRGRSSLVFALLGLALWFVVLRSGIHATIAGVVLALTIPAGPEENPPMVRWASALHPWVSFFIMPVFALANAGLVVEGTLLESLANPIASGIIAGLVVGKPLGIALFSWLSVRSGLAELPRDANWRHIFGIGCVGGIGFTMSLFVAGLAFPTAGNLDIAKAGILSGSLAAALIGWAWLWRSLRKV